MIRMRINLLEHLKVLQDVVCELGPEQAFPPRDGAGLLQDLLLLLTPPPQDLLQDPYALQAPYSPFSTKGNEDLLAWYGGTV